MRVSEYHGLVLLVTTRCEPTPPPARVPVRAAAGGPLCRFQLLMCGRRRAAHLREVRAWARARARASIRG